MIVSDSRGAGVIVSDMRSGCVCDVISIKDSLICPIMEKFTESLQSTQPATGGAIKNVVPFGLKTKTFHV